jgi:hypothetical protein
VALLNMQGHSRLTSDAKAASSLCPEKLHCIQGAGAVDLLEEMQWPVGQEGSARLLATDATLDEGARFKVEVNGGVPVHIDESFDKYNQHYRQVQPAINGGVPVHIDESFDKYNQHYRQVHPAMPLVKPSSFITVVVADPGHMDRIDGGAVSANPLGEYIYPDRTGSRNKRGVGDGPQDVQPKAVFLARNLSAITASNARLCSGRIRGEGHDHHGRLNAATAAKLQEQAASQDIEVQPQDRCVVRCRGGRSAGFFLLQRYDLWSGKGQT